MYRSRGEREHDFFSNLKEVPLGSWNEGNSQGAEAGDLEAEVYSVRRCVEFMLSPV